ncbi:MAG: DUF11 domain-containing protein [Candidatus Viridilinea halotolerans]|uniref:DUF11 domain-containing protein n=1 Tax=Candidatus Viridilinea halotolerans TaxID=2491704 RepID=A0A426TSA7_9CHLR|nr:MAG: DUF11 domain-containing protein [Candidatus Viridilinea halotolerans]
MILNQRRTLFASLGISLACVLALMFFGSWGGPRQAAANNGNGQPTLTVRSTPAVPVLGDTFVVTLTMSNPLTSDLNNITVTQVLTPNLAMTGHITYSGLVGGSCATEGWPCSGKVVSGTSAIITATYLVSETGIVGRPISYTTTITSGDLAAPLVQPEEASAAVVGPAFGLMANLKATDRIALGDRLVLTMAITNSAQMPLSGITLTQQLTPSLTAPMVVSSGIDGCTTLPCSNATIMSNTTALVTATYFVDRTVGQAISYSATLSMTALSVPVTKIGITGQVGRAQIFLPLVRTAPPPVDRYADAWQRVEVAPGKAVKHIYIDQTPNQCAAGPVAQQLLPRTILVGTDDGIYRLIHASQVDGAFSWELLNGTTGADILQIMRVNNEYFAADVRNGKVLRSSDDGANWVVEDLPGNRRTYALATVGGRILAAGLDGLFIRAANGAWSRDPAISGAVFSVAAVGDVAYAVQVGTPKDTLWISSAGAPWQRIGQLPNPANFIQSLHVSAHNPNVLIGTVGNGVYQLSGNLLTPFAPAPALTVYEIWRDTQGRSYASFREDGGLRRINADASIEVLHTGTTMNEERLFTVKGYENAQCGILMAGSTQGGLWLRRLPE